MPEQLLQKLKEYLNKLSKHYEKFTNQFASKDTEFLADTNLKNLQGPKQITHLILWIATAFIFIGIIWANFAMVDEVARGQGKVIPSSQVQVIQNLEGGIVQKIYVKEGDIVNKGQMLMQMDPTRFQSAYEEDRAKVLALTAKTLRLTAEVNKLPFNPPADLMKEVPDIVNNEKALSQSRISQLKQLQTNLELATKELNMTQPLVAKGAASDVEVLRLQRAVSDLNGQIDDFKSKALADLNDAKAQLDTAKQSMLANQDRVTRTTILSPVKGIVKQIKITTVGGVAQPGADLMEIVPLEDTLLIEAQISPKDIGFIHINQSAMVKITAYDYSIYGGLDGKVEQISADTISDEKGNSFYLVRVRTQKNYLGNKDHQLFIIPGMTASVEVLTGKRSIMHYILKPLLKAREQALKER